MEICCKKNVGELKRMEQDYATNFIHLTTKILKDFCFLQNDKFKNITMIF